MAEEAYETALRQALEELAEVDRQAEEIERKRAKLRQGVAVLQTLTGDQRDQDQSVTSSILTVLNASPGHRCPQRKSFKDCSRWATQHNQPASPRCYPGWRRMGKS